MALLAAPLAAQQKCATDAVVAQVHARQSELLKVQVEDMTNEVPPAARGQISHLKDALATAVDAGMGCVPAGSDAATIERSLAKLLGANQPEKPFTPSNGPSDVPVAGIYGADLDVAVSTPTNAPQLRAVEVSFGIECGEDTLLLLYEAKPEGWRQVLRWQSGDYADISGAFGGFFLYAILPGDVPGERRVAVVHGTDWCTSRFSGLKLYMLAPSAAGGAPRVVWHTERSYSRGDSVPRLRSTADGFELRLNDVALDIDGYERSVIYRYRVAGDQVVRVAPIATNGRGFVEEWLTMPWDEAKAQTSPNEIEGMKVVHERLAKSDKDVKTYVSYKYGPVRACSVKGRYEVEMEADPGGKQFYAIEEGQSGYMMVNFGTTQDERCSGPDLMKKR